MVNKKVETPTNSELIGEENAMEEMWVSMDNLRCQNWTLEDNFLNIQIRQHETNPLEHTEILYLQLGWGVGPLLLKNFKSLSLTKLDGHSDPFDHVASINT